MDWTHLLSIDRDGDYFEEPAEANTYLRRQFEKEYHFIVSSPSFRRLQDKTQVFPLDTSDFVRTRLTHSLETSSLAKTLAEMVAYHMLHINEYNNDVKFKDIRQHNNENSGNTERDISNILMCAGLLHDIGNPPFGHFGETIIQDWFKDNLPAIKYKDNDIENFLGKDSPMLQDFYHFEGNAQAFRLLTKLHFQDDEDGLHLTYALLNTLIKYPTASNAVEGKKATDICRKKMGYFYAETGLYHKIATKTDTLHKRHPLTFLLESADDIAYATADLEDAFKKGMFTYEQLIQLFENHEYGPEPNKKFQKKTSELLSRLQELKAYAEKEKFPEPEMYAIRNWIPYVQFWFLYCTSYAFTKNYHEIMDGSYLHDLFYNTFHEYSVEILQNVMKKYVYPAPSIEKLEIAAHSIITGLLKKFIKAALYFDTNFDKTQYPEWQMRGVDEKLMRLIPNNYMEVYKREKQGKSEKEQLYFRLLMITDFICGMSDSYAKALFQELEGIY